MCNGVGGEREERRRIVLQKGAAHMTVQFDEPRALRGLPKQKEETHREFREYHGPGLRSHSVRVNTDLLRTREEACEVAAFLYNLLDQISQNARERLGEEFFLNRAPFMHVERTLEQSNFGTQVFYTQERKDNVVAKEEEGEVFLMPVTVETPKRSVGCC